MIDLNKPRFKILVNHHVKSKNLETKLILNIFWLTRAIDVPHARLPSDQRLYNHIVYSCFQGHYIRAKILQYFEYLGEGSLVTPTSAFLRLILFKVVCTLVN